MPYMEFSIFFFNPSLNKTFYSFHILLEYMSYMYIVPAMYPESMRVSHRNKFTWFYSCAVAALRDRAADSCRNTAPPCGVQSLPLAHTYNSITLSYFSSLFIGCLPKPPKITSIKDGYQCPIIGGSTQLYFLHLLIQYQHDCSTNMADHAHGVIIAAELS